LEDFLGKVNLACLNPDIVVLFKLVIVWLTDN